MNIQNLIDRVRYYLQNGGLHNPELASHYPVRDLIIDLRDALEEHQWRDISTALVSRPYLFFGDTWRTKNLYFTGWKSVNGTFYSDDGRIAYPTHWMPIQPPETE